MCGDRGVISYLQRVLEPAESLWTINLSNKLSVWPSGVSMQRKNSFRSDYDPLLKIKN